MAKRKPTGSRALRRKKKEITWLGTIEPVGLRADLVLWVDRDSGETVAQQVMRPSESWHGFERTCREEIAKRKTRPKVLWVPETRLAYSIRGRFEGIAVSCRSDKRGQRMLGEAIEDSPLLAEPRMLGLFGTEKVLTLKISLRDTSPPIWRRIRIADDVSLYVLHLVIQHSMGWEDCHLHEFSIGGERYSARDEDARGDFHDEETVQLKDVLVAGKRFEYWYDFGDDWMHDIEVEKVESASEGDPVAECIDGARACPPEDSGGPFGYEQKLEALRDPKDRDDYELREWIGEDFDPEKFELKDAKQEVDALFVFGGQSEEFVDANHVDGDDAELDSSVAVL